MRTASVPGVVVGFRSMDQEGKIESRVSGVYRSFVEQVSGLKPSWAL